MRIDGKFLTGGPVRLSFCDESVYAICDECKKSECAPKAEPILNLLARLRYTGCNHGIGTVERAATRAWSEQAMWGHAPAPPARTRDEVEKLVRALELRVTALEANQWLLRGTDILLR